MIEYYSDIEYSLIHYILSLTQSTVWGSYTAFSCHLLESVVIPGVRRAVEENLSILQ